MNKEQDKENIEEIKKVIVENSECIPSEMSELVDTLIASIRAEAYERGFIAGADATGSQAEEVLALKLKEQENRIKQETKEIERYVRKGKPKCSCCGKLATTQTSKGESNLKSGGLTINDGWYCDECYRKGLEIEKEAMYGDDY